MIGALAETIRNPNRLQVALVALVAGSCGLVALSVGASAPAVLAASAIGVVLGVLMSAYLTYIVPEGGATNRPGRRRR